MSAPHAPRLSASRCLVCLSERLALCGQTRVSDSQSRKSNGHDHHRQGESQKPLRTYWDRYSDSRCLSVRRRSCAQVCWMCVPAILAVRIDLRQPAFPEVRELTQAERLPYFEFFSGSPSKQVQGRRFQTASKSRLYPPEHQAYT